jgi:hypothetical protein
MCEEEYDEILRQVLTIGPKTLNAQENGDITAMFSIQNISSLKIFAHPILSST